MIVNKGYLKIKLMEGGERDERGSGEGGGKGEGKRERKKEREREREREREKTAQVPTVHSHHCLLPAVGHT